MSGSASLERDPTVAPRPTVPPRGGTAAPRPTVPPRARLDYVAGDVLVNKYRLLSLLGEGGMGCVWKARCLTLDIDVAVKLVRRDLADSDAKERLLREARAAASIGHPSIVRILDFGRTESDEPYLVMELLHGQSLSELLDARERMPAAEAVPLLLPLVSALAAAHAQGIIHRDVKPENIFVIPGERRSLFPKIIDFGIVKTVAAREKRVLTEAGTLIGSPDYMSPEQGQGSAEIGGQTDIWSLSIVLYEMITGYRPFSGSHPGAVVLSILRDTPVPSTELGGGDADLWAILERGLAKSPSQRWPSMRAFGCALAGWAQDRGIEVDSTGVLIAREWICPRSIAAGSSSDPDLTGSSSTPPRDSHRALAVTVRAPDSEPSSSATPTLRLVTAPRRRLPWAAGLAITVLGLGALALSGRDAPPPASAAAAEVPPIAASSPPAPAVDVDPAPPAQTLAEPAPIAMALSAPIPSASARPRVRAVLSSPQPANRVSKASMPLPTTPNF